ncbi:hypothetical protein AB0I37_14335 [Micromonospora purpureochromogenes]|uniref:hypothetical protein n=1 Tax=Micromonospora purpureochromogenes TaxID=47872 RepID=UPI0033FE90DA
MNAPTEHPRWCDRKTCDRLGVHASRVLPVNTGRTEETVLDVALVQSWLPASEPQLSMTVIDGVDFEQVLMSLGQGRVLAHRLRQLLDDAKGGAK